MLQKQTLMKTTVELATNDLIEKYCFISDTFVKVVERFASLKKKLSQDIKPLLWIRNWKRQYSIKIGLEIILFKNPTKQNEKSTKYNKTSVSLKKKTIKSCYKNISKAGVTNKNLWSIIKPFLTNEVLLKGKKQS